MPLFGDERAEYDYKRLSDCYVPEIELGEKIKNEEEIILTGKWGTGKTACMLMAHQDLDKLLYKMGGTVNRIWYLDQNCLDISALIELKNKMSDDSSKIIRVMEKIWYAEIIRTEAQILSKLKNYYDYSSKSHWKEIIKISYLFDKYNFFWKSIDSLLDIIFKKRASLGTIQYDFETLLSDKMFTDIQKCLLDIKGNKIQPVIVIEPIESPTQNFNSRLGLAHALVVALMNTFTNYFVRNKRQLMKVQIIVPWHLLPCYLAYSGESSSWGENYGVQVDRPQHVYQYITQIECNKKRLYEIIKKRIEWEFKRAKKNFQGDAWNILFCEEVKGEHSKKICFEKSFDYICRHTPHRARAIIRVARECVKEFLKKENLKKTQFLQMYKNPKIDENTIRKVVKRLNMVFTQELLYESKRRYAGLDRILNKMRSLKIPCDRETFETHIGKESDIEKVINTLWTCGFLGIEVSLSKQTLNEKIERESYKKKITSELGDDTFIEYRYKGEIIPKWFLFNYNFDRNPNYILIYYNKKTYSLAKIIFHPITFSMYEIRSTADYPIGI